MTHPSLSLLRRSHRPALAAAGTVALLLTTAPGGAATVPDHAGRSVPDGGATINTYKDWDRDSFEGAMGAVSYAVATDGQVITIPASKTDLRKFVFYLRSYTLTMPGRLVFRGEVYAWNGEHAVGRSLWESKRKVFHVEPQGQELWPVVFRTRGVDVVPGTQYVLFMSVSKDYSRNDPVAGEWGAVLFSGLHDGSHVYMFNADDPSWWTTHEWYNDETVYDLAMKVYLQ